MYVFVCKNGVIPVTEGMAVRVQVVYGSLERPGRGPGALVRSARWNFA